MVVKSIVCLVVLFLMISSTAASIDFDVLKKIDDELVKRLIEASFDQNYGPQQVNSGLWRQLLEARILLQHSEQIANKVVSLALDGKSVDVITGYVIKNAAIGSHIAKVVDYIGRPTIFTVYIHVLYNRKESDSYHRYSRRDCFRS